MKFFVCIFSFFIIPSTVFYQPKEWPLGRMYFDQYYLECNDHKKNVYCVHHQDTIIGINLQDNLYEFHVSNDSSIIVYLSRAWNPIKPFWNTCLKTNIISLLPIGVIRNVYNGDTIQSNGFKSAYMGPKYSSLHKMQKRRMEQGS